MTGKPPTERRSSERIDLELWVEESTPRELYFQRCANLSAGGIFLERTIPHAKGTVVSLKFTLPDDSTPLVVRGEIVNVGESSSDLGMGVKFLELSDEQRQRIDDFIKKASTKKP
jgi:uncharacterized protein (TIGR02266 family)